jgi:DNA repair photolyase
MYPWVTHTKSFLTGECPHNCSYCYVQAMAKRYPSMQARYSGPLGLDQKELLEPLGENHVIFIEHLNDLFADEVSDLFIERVVNRCLAYPKNKYVYQTKNPGRYLDHYQRFYPDTILGTTIETNRHIPEVMRRAPHPKSRYASMLQLPRVFRIFVTIEPILDFDIEVLTKWLLHLRPNFINIGADSKGAKLPEPSADKVLALIDAMKGGGIEIRQKSNLSRLLNVPAQRPPGVAR